MDTSCTTRPVGDVLLELEPLLFELVETQGLQLGELLALIKCWTEIHYPDAVENYLDETQPIYFYGHKQNLIDFAKKLK